MNHFINKVDTNFFSIEFYINHNKGCILSRYLAKNKGKQLPKEILNYNKNKQ